MEILEKRYFAAVNSGAGFESRFSEVFGGAKKHFIIKGGPGTGKSYFMRVIADEAEKMGHEVEYFYCSSDPDSLDGIIITDLNIAVTDGTSPHSVEPVYPGTRDIIIDIGRFWSFDILDSSAGEIHKLTDSRSALWKDVYRWLGAAAKLEAEYDLMLGKHILQDKIDAFALRVTKDFKPDGGRYKTRILSAISMKGAAQFDTFERLAERKIILRDRYGIAHAVYSAILKRLCESGVSAFVSYEPLTPEHIDGLYIPSVKTAICTASSSDREAQTISCERFLCLDSLKSDRMKLRFINKCKAEVMDGSYRLLDEIRGLHFKLEEIYVAAMDFSAKEQFTEEFIKKHLKENENLSVRT